MGLREVRTLGDPVLRKRSREVDKIDERIQMLIDDMEETMYTENGVGLAAPQVGVLRRVIVVNVGEGLIAIINPVVVQSEGSITEDEGCLSVPGRVGAVERPAKVRVKGLNRNGEEIDIVGEDLLARAFCHEIDHLDGVLFIDRMDEDESR